MARRRVSSVVLGSLTLLVLGLIFWPRPQRVIAGEGVDTLLLLLPDGADTADPRVTIWTDAALEEGLHVRIARDAEFLQHPRSVQKYRGVILPDQVHRTASGALVDAVRQYVQAGGQLLLVYDAGTLTPAGVYPIPRSRFSEIAGIDYALYDQLRARTTGLTRVWGTPANLRALAVPPGKYMPVAAAAPDREPLAGIAGYRYGFLRYPVFATRGRYAGTALLTTPTGGLVAGYHPQGHGGVLFANLPLGYLKGRTDGLLLHGTLHYFAVQLLHLPYLSALPGGTAGMVINVHCDSNAALGPIARLGALGIWKEGPFSIHLTAGPDDARPGDGLGLNVNGNPVIQQWIAQCQARGHTIGSHGGWDHDYYSRHASETNEDEFEKYLLWNNAALARVTGHPILEYSAPRGNQPEWSTTWLEQHGVLGYYFTGNTGMPPTRSYRFGRRLNPHIWSFPFTSYGSDATFEEFTAHHISDAEITPWLTSLVDFCVEQRSSRLIYFHPPGVAVRPAPIQTLLRQGDQYARAGRFHWYTMTRLAEFLNCREEVRWSVTQAEDGTQHFDAERPAGLSEQTWVLPASVYQQPAVVSGTGTVRQDQGEWLVTCTAGPSISFAARPNTRP